jgi:hypothetical protein
VGGVDGSAVLPVLRNGRLFGARQIDGSRH